MSVLSTNCSPEFSADVCAFANVCGLISTAIWFIVMFPQLIHNYRRGSVAGVSALWAVINFTAAMNNCFFVFKLGGMPLFSHINAVYLPLLGFAMVLQFWWYTRKAPSRKRTIFISICILIWIAIALAQIFFKVQSVFEWVSITLWSIGTFPQLILNMERRSTFGLSPAMIAFTAFGKTTDFLSNYLLVLPMQYVVMTYFSSTTVWIDTLQVLYHWNQVPSDELKKSRSLEEIESTQGNSQNTNNTTEDATQEKSQDGARSVLKTFANQSDAKSEVPHNEQAKILQTPVEQQLDGGRVQLPISPLVNVIRLVATIVLIFELCLGTVGLIWRTGTWISCLCPIGIIAILGIAHLYLRRNARGKQSEPDCETLQTDCELGEVMA